MSLHLWNDRHSVIPYRGKQGTTADSSLYVKDFGMCAYSYRSIHMLTTTGSGKIPIGFCAHHDNNLFLSSLGDYPGFLELLVPDSKSSCLWPLLVCRDKCMYIVSMHEAARIFYLLKVLGFLRGS